MIRFSGVESFSAPRTVVADRLSDAAFLASCVPDATVRSATATADAAEWRARANVGFASATLDSRLTIVDRTPGQAVTFQLQNRATGAGLDVSTQLTFADAGPDATEVAWAAIITARSGLLKFAPASLLQSQVQSLMRDLWQDVRRKLAPGGQPTA